MDDIKRPRRPSSRPAISTPTQSGAPQAIRQAPSHHTREQAGKVNEVRRPVAKKPLTQQSSQHTPRSAPHTQTAGLREAAGKPVANSSPRSEISLLSKIFKKLIQSKKILAAVLCVGVLCVVAVSILWQSLAYGFKQVTYNNGQGATYSFDFYRRSTIEKSSAATPSAALSTVSRAGKEPLTVTVAQLANKPDDAAIFCYSNGDDKFIVKHKPTKKDIFVCSAKESGTVSMYSAIFESKGKWHRLIATQHVSTVNEEGIAPETVMKKRLGTEPYKSDVVRVLSNIQSTQ